MTEVVITLRLASPPAAAALTRRGLGDRVATNPQVGVGASADRAVSMRCNGVSRNAEWRKSLLFFFSAEPTDNQMRYFQDVIARAVAGLPEDLR